MEKMKFELKNMQNKCCLIIKSRGELNIQQNEKTNEAKGFHNIAPSINRSGSTNVRHCIACTSVQEDNSRA